ncbi:MAG: hypothetical protein ABI488_18210 [Polyangiaceae bacterium]
MLRATQVIAFGFVLNSSAANAQGQGQHRFALDYQGTFSCPSEGELLAEVLRRAPSAQNAPDGPYEVQARLRVTADGQRQRGVIDIDSREGSTHREIEATECAEVVRALALILAMAIEPDAGAPAAAPASATRLQPLEAPPPLARLTSRPPAPRLRWAAGGGVGLAGGVAPSPSLSEGLFFELGRGRDAGLSANVRLAGVHAHGTATARAGSADFELFGLRLASCPYRLGTRVSLSGCVSFDWGRLQGRGSHTLSERSASAAWLGPGGFVDAEVQALPWLRLQLELGALLPLARDSFYFGPDETVHRIPNLAGYGGFNVLVGG